MNIYQEIWDADQQGNGIKPVLSDEGCDEQQGFMVVNEKYTGNREQKLFTRVVIPDHKMHSYELCKQLFNNYALSPEEAEVPTPEEDAEIHNLLEAIVESKPMKTARQWLSLQTGEAYSVPRWYNILLETWFARFTQSSGVDLSAFEHVVVGEQKGPKVSGYHFWYKYYLDDSQGLSMQDDIHYRGTKGKSCDEDLLVPEVSTITFEWDAFDYTKNVRRPLFKKIGGFFNGCSIEGLLALGTVRFLHAGRPPKEAVINGAKYNMKMFRSQNGKHMRTFYPEFVGITDETGDVCGTGDVSTPTEVTETAKSVRIVAALVNPAGKDPGLENVTLINATPRTIDLGDWEIEDQNGNCFTIEPIAIEPGSVIRIPLPEDSAQLSNKGGIINLKDKNGNRIDSVSYTREQARKESWTVVF